MIEFIEKFISQKIQHKYSDLLNPKTQMLNQTYYDGSQYIGSKRSTDKKLLTAKKWKIFSRSKLDLEGLNGESFEQDRVLSDNHRVGNIFSPLSSAQTFSPVKFAFDHVNDFDLGSDNSEKSRD